MQGLLIETRNDLPATFHSTLIPRHFSELTLTARLHENLSLFTDTLFASDIFFSTPLPLFFQLFGIDHTITDGGGHCSILPRCPKVYTNKGTREIVSQPFHPTDSRKSSSKPRRKREAEREREVDTLRGAKDTERVGEREKITGSFVPFVRGSSSGEDGLETEKIFLTGWRGACIYLGVVSRVHTPPLRRKHAGVTTPAIIINPFSAIPPGYAYPLLLNRTAVARHAACSNRKNRASRGGTKGQSPHLQSEWKIWRNAIWRDCFPFAGGRGRNAVGLDRFRPPLSVSFSKHDDGRSTAVSIGYDRN